MFLYSRGCALFGCPPPRHGREREREWRKILQLLAAVSLLLFYLYKSPQHIALTRALLFARLEDYLEEWETDRARIQLTPPPPVLHFFLSEPAFALKDDSRSFSAFSL